jgi:phospholipase/carboxylesterase
MPSANPEDIHQSQPVLTFGAPLNEAKAAAILLHGRGASPQSMLELAEHFGGEGVAYLMPAASQLSWWPRSGFAPMEVNEPYISSALATVRGLVQQVIDAGIPTEKLVIGGFSQGAVLSSEFVARYPARYGAVIIFSGALMGTLDDPRDYAGSLEGTPVFIGGVTHDSWIPQDQQRLTIEVLGKMGAAVTTDIITGTAHSIRESEMTTASAMVAAALT